MKTSNTFPPCWPDGTPCRCRNAFVGYGYTTSEPVNWSALQNKADLRRASTNRVEAQRAEGIEPGRIYGMSLKSDEILARAAIQRQAAVLQDRHGGAYQKARGPQSNDKAAQLRKALIAGPMTAQELSAATGIEPSMISPTLQWSLHNGQVKQLRGARPFRYALASGEGCFFADAGAKARAAAQTSEVACESK